jgi:hypothetical protein
MVYSFFCVPLTTVKVGMVNRKMFMELVYWLRGEISSGEGLFTGLILR